MAPLHCAAKFDPFLHQVGGRWPNPILLCVLTSDHPGLQQNSEFAQLLNYWMAKLDESGVMQEMMRDRTHKGLDKFWVDDAVELGYQHIAFPFILLVGGISLALIMLSYEKIRGKSAKSKEMMESPENPNKFKEGDKPECLTRWLAGQLPEEGDACLPTMGPYLNDVRTGRGKGWHPKRVDVREVS